MTASSPAGLFHTSIWTTWSVLQSIAMQNNPATCVFAAASLESLGHTVSEAGAVPSSLSCEGFEGLPQAPGPQGPPDFLGLVNFYRCLLLGLAGLLQPLNDAFRGQVQAPVVDRGHRHKIIGSPVLILLWATKKVTFLKKKFARVKFL